MAKKISTSPDSSPGQPVITRIFGAKFKHPVLPGDTMQISVKIKDELAGVRITSYNVCYTKLLRLLRRLERHLHVSLPDIYQRINGYLIERGILPDLKRTFRRPPGASREASVSEQATPAATPPASDARNNFV